MSWIKIKVEMEESDVSLDYKAMGMEPPPADRWVEDALLNLVSGVMIIGVDGKCLVRIPYVEQNIYTESSLDEVAKQLGV